MRTLCGWIALAGMAAAAPLKLAEKGKSSYRICVGPEASPSERRGAAELQRFLFEMSGAKLEQSCAGKKLILVGRSPQTDLLKVDTAALGDEGFVLRTEGEKLIIAGGRKRGTMYGVYTFLERLGCRWFTREVSRIPKRPTITAPALNETIRPAFEYRETFFREAFDKDWAARNRMNGATMQLDESTGGKVTYYPFVHSFEQLIPPGKYFAEHPEYFSLIDGRRRRERSQLCLTNPDVLRLGVAQLLRWMEEHPEAGIYSVSQNDWQGWCECENCRRVEAEEGGVHSGPLIRYVNAVAEETEKRHPEKLIDTLAYWYTEEAPKQARPRKNVRIRLCPIGACEAHPYEKCPRNAYFMRALRDWSKLTDRLYIWHYNTNFAHYLLPFPDFDELVADIPMYRRHGVVGLFMQGAYSKGGGGENAELRSYVMAKLLWDTRADAQRAIDEFLEAVYEGAARPMRAYFELLHEQVRRGPHLYIFMNPGAPYLGGDFLPRAAKLFAEADRMAGSEAVRRRVRQARLSIDYAELARDTRFEFRDGLYAPKDAAGLRARYADLARTATGYGMTNLSESRTIAQDAEAYAARTRDYPAVRLENAQWRLDAVPELGGRLMAMVEKATGRNALYEAEAGAYGYPEMGGEALIVGTDYHTVSPLKVQWTAERAGGETLILRGKAERGVEVERRIGLSQGGEWVRSEAAARNAGNEEVEVALLIRLHADGGPLEGTRFLEVGKPPAGRIDFGTAELARGEWEFARPGLRWRVRYRPEMLDRMSLNWTDRDTRGLRLEIWSKKARLGSGQSVRLEAEYRMESGR